MAMMKLCRCNKPIPIQEPMCDSCQGKDKERHKLYNQTARDKTTQSFYNSKAWKQLSKEVYTSQQGLCQMCLEDNKITTGTTNNKGKFKRNVVDHKVPITIDWNKRLDKTNLWVLCPYHHSIKTEEDKKKYLRGGR